MTFEQILEAERRGELSFQQQAALDELRRRGVIPEATPVEAVAAPQQRTGLGAAVGRGAESLIGTSTTGIQAITGDANEAAELALKRAAVSPYAEQVSWDKVKEVYGTQGALAAAMEVARQVPLAIAEQLPQLAASAGATAAGAKLGALTSPVTGPFGPIIGGGLGFAASSFPGLLGGNIERQAAEQQATGRPIDIDVGAAARGAAGQTVLEAAGTLIPLGRRAIGALFGPEVKALLDQGKKEAAEALARESLPVVLAKGTAVGVAAEVPTEILQSAIERYQAGLDILSDDALSEYGSAAYQAALVSPIGAAGRVADRSGARAGIEAEKQAQAAREQKAQADKQRQEAQAEEQRRKSPDYILEVADKYESLAKQEDDLKAQIKRATKDAPLSREDADRNAVIQQQLKALKPQRDQARKDYIALGGPDAVKKARESQLQLTPPPGRVSEPPPAAPVEEVETEDAKRARLTRDERNLAELLQQQRAAMADTTSVDQTLRAATQATQTSQQLAEVQRQLGELPKLPVLEEVEAEIQKRVKPLQKAVKAGDNEKVVTLAQEILALEKQRDAARARQARMSPDQGLFAPEMVEAEAQRREALAGEIAQGRETARGEREAGVAEEAEGARRQRTVEREADALRRIGAAEEPVRGAIQESREVNRILQTYGGLRRGEQTELFPEGREQVTQTSVEESETDLRNELNRLQQAKKELLKRGEAQEGLPYAAAEGPFTQLLDIEVGRGYVADRVKALDARIAEVKDLLLTDKVQLQDKIAELEKRRAEKQALPQEELAGALSREPGQIVDIDRRLAALRERLDTLQAGAMERKTVTVPADAEPTSQPVEAGEGPSWIPSRPSTRPAAQGPQVSTRPKEPLQAQIAALAERVLAAPNVDEDTKDVVRQMQDDLPAFLRTATRQTVQGAKEQRARATGRAPSAAAETMAPQDVASWLYRTLTSGRADAATTAKARDVLRTLEEAKRSETETMPSGEIRRVAQQEFPEMPEPRATAFNTYEEFENYLATAAPTTKDAAGNVIMSVSRLQRELAPIREQAAALRAQEADLKQQAEALKAKTGAERAAAQAKLDEAKFTLTLTRNALENRIERMLTARSLAQQKYSDALTENIRVLMDISESAKQFEAEIAARDPVRVAGPAGSPQQLGPVGQGFRSATIRQGDLAGYDQARSAERTVEKALDAWIAAETKLRDVVQANVGADLSDGSPALNAYLRAKDAREEAKLDVDNAVKDLKRVNAKRKVVTPLSSDAFGDFLIKQAQLADQLEAAQKRVTGFSKALRFHADKADLDAFLKRRDSAQVALSKAIRELPEGGDVGAVLRNHMKPLEDAKTALADKLSSYKGTREQIDAFDKAQADLKAAEELMAEVAVATRPDDAQAEQLLAAAKTPAVQAGKLESVVQQRLLAARERAEARRRVAPTPPATTLSEREAADGDRRRAEQARLEGAEYGRTLIQFEEASERKLADEKYVKLVEAANDLRLSVEERMDASVKADAYLESRVAKLAKEDAQSASNVKLHGANLESAQSKLESLQNKRESLTLSRDELRKHKTPEAQQARLEEKRAKFDKAITEQNDLIAKHRRLLDKALRYPTVTRIDPAEFKAYRERLNEDILRTRVAGERLGVAEGTQQRAIGPATRPEVMAPKTMRTGSAESVAGKTTTPSKNRIQEARGVRQRDVPMSKKEIAEANLTAAQMELAEAQTPVDKRVAEIKVEIAEVGLEIATKGETDTRGIRKAALENELGVAEDVRKKAKETAVAPKEAAQLQEGVIVVAEAPADGSVWVPEITVKLGGDTYSKTGAETQVTLGKPAKTGTMSVATVLIRKDSTRFSDGKGSIITVDNSELVYEHVEKNKYMVLKRTDKDAAKIEKWKKALGAPLVEAFFKNKGKKTQPAVTKAALGKDIEPQVTKVAEYFEDAYAADIELSAEDVNLSRGATANPSTVDSVRAELKKAFPDLGRVQIYDSVDALIEANPQYEGRIPDNARGFVDSAGNKAFLIAENIDQGRALGVLLHEVGAHIGLKNVLGDAQYNALVKAVETWAKKDDGSVESRVAKAAQARVEAAETPASQRRDETLAYAIEEAVNAGVKPMETKGPLGQWLGRIAQLFRRALEKFGLPPKALDAQGLVDMAFGAAKVEMTPAVPQMSRRMFLRGASAALGALKLPPLSKDMQVSALKAAFNASRSGYAAWANTLSAAAKTKATKTLIDDFADDFLLADKAQTPALRRWLQLEEVDGIVDYDLQLEELLSRKDGVEIVADLQQALQAQRAALVDAVQKTAKEKGLPEVGELFFSGQEKPSAFKRWFGNSKVVNKDGKPLVVYHGTGADFSTFDPDRKAVSGGYHGKGFYFGDAGLADAYLDKEIPGATIMPVYLSMENPFYGELTSRDIARMRTWPRFEKAYASLVQEYEPGYVPSIEALGVRDEELGGERNEFIQQALVKGGYDGRIVTFKPDAPWADEDTEYVVFRPSQIKSATGNRGTYDPTDPNILFSKAPKYAPSLSEAGKVADKLIAPQRSFMGKLKANLLGFRVQAVDRLDPFVKAFERGVSAGLLSDLKATQAMYYLRMQGQQMHFTSQAISDGAPMLVEKQRKDGETEYVIEAKADGANIKKVVDILSRKEVAKEAGSPDAANRLLTLYMGAIRAENKGFDKLNFGRAAAERELVQLRNELKSETLKPNERARVTRRIEKLTANMDRLPSEQEIRAAKAAVEANPTLKKAFDEARDLYNAYNRDLISFAAETGTIAKDEAARLLRDNDYIPYYRERGGVAELVIGSETPMRIGNLKDSPHLVELMGDQEPIFDFLTSSVQNTSMLIDMSMHNLAVKNAMWELASAGLARNYRVQTEKGKRRDIPEGAVRFRVKGEDWYSVVDTDTIGVPSELLVKGLAGIPTMFPFMVQVLGMPARLLRRLIVASPIYAARQLFRDSLAASIASGANTVPVLSALKQIRRKSALDARGVAGGQVFTGMPEDMTRLLREMQSGRPGWAKAFSKLEAMSMEADAATRRAQYDSYIEQGLSEMEATYMSLESMNFTKRGVSPTIHMLSTLIPFFNAQIQGLDVLYKSFTGKMPFNERLKVREKLIKRGLLMAGMSLAYAAAMQDEEEYKNATPDQKYGNWFVRMPFLDELAGERVTVRVPIPFELGYIFKALPEALYNTMATEEGGEDAAKAFKQILINTIPGGSSYMMPAAVKPLIEVGLGKSFFTGRDLETAQEQQLQPFARYRDQTSEAAKAVGSMFNVSPVKLEALISGYTGSLGLALLQTLNFAVPDTGPEGATKRLSQVPLAGTLFQPSDAQGIIDAAYARMNEVRQVQQTYEALLKESPERAAKYAQDKINEMALASAEGNFRQQLGKLTTYERQVRAAPTLTAQEKRERLDQLRQAKIRVASQARALLDRRAPQAAPA